MVARRRKAEETISVSPTNKMSKDTEARRQFVKQWFIGAASAVLTMSVLAFLVFGNYINLSGKVADSQLWEASYYQRLEFTMRYQVLGAGWVLFSVYYVIINRVKAKRGYDPLAEDEIPLTIAKFNLSNSLEQFILSFFAQIISLSYLDEACLLKLIPLVNLYLLIGRIGFLVGYPMNRIFGFWCSILPTSLLYIYNAFAFLNYLLF